VSSDHSEGGIRMTADRCLDMASCIDDLDMKMFKINLSRSDSTTVLSHRSSVFRKRTWGTETSKYP
jgi:hypothetical protein